MLYGSQLIVPLSRSDNFKPHLSKIRTLDRTRLDQTRPDQTGPGQAGPDGPDGTRPTRRDQTGRDSMKFDEI